MDIAEILSMVGTYGGFTTVITIVGGWFYRKQNLRLKEAETALAEANVDKAKMAGKADEFHYYKEQLTEAQKTIIDLQHAQRESNSKHHEDIKALEERYEAQMGRKDAIIEDKTEKVRQYHEELFKSEETINALYERQLKLEKENADLRVENERVRCEDLPCPFRIPPNAHTRNHNGQTKEQYHSQKRLPNYGTD